MEFCRGLVIRSRSETISAVATLLSLLSVGSAPMANALPEESLLDLYFLKLLGQRGMISMTTDEGQTTETGKMVCMLISSGFEADYISTEVSNLMDYGPPDIDIRNSIFTALAIRTYCPPSINDASWRDQPWAHP